MGDLSTVYAFQKMGETIVAVQAERARQAATAPHGPSWFARKLAEQEASKDHAAIEQQMLAAAARRAFPIKYNKKPPSNEMEQLIADAPKSSAQVIGSHKVPKITAPPPPKGQVGELGAMRKVFPRSTAGEVGFHHPFEAQNKRDARAATELMDSLSVAAVRGDPAMQEALSTIKASVMTASRRFGHSGVPRGVQLRRDAPARN